MPGSMNLVLKGLFLVLMGCAQSQSQGQAEPPAQPHSAQSIDDEDDKKKKGAPSPMCDIFISLRFAESKPQANAIKKELAARGISAYVCKVESGDNIMKDIMKNLKAAKLAIIMGSRTYGAKGSSNFSTQNELEFIMNPNYGKPFYLIKMCDVFEEAMAQMLLPDSISYDVWMPGKPMPSDLIDKIVKKFKGVTGSAETTAEVQVETKPSPAKKSEPESDSKIETEAEFKARVKAEAEAEAQAELEAEEKVRMAEAAEERARSEAEMKAKLKAQIKAQANPLPNFEKVFGKSAVSFVEEDGDLMLDEGKCKTVEQAQAVAAILSSNAKVEGWYGTIRLGKNDMGDEAASIILNALKDNHTVEDIYLEYNNLTDAIAPAVESVLKANKYIEFISLEDNSFSDDTKSALKAAGGRNYRGEYSGWHRAYF